MPNPKAGTVVSINDLPRTIEDARKGRVEYKLDKTSIVHVAVGKTSFEEQKLLENLTAIIEAVVKAKPSGAKGQYIKSIFLTTTMGPSVKLDLNAASALSAA
jgi:large subunit ribosomal protein L1